MSKMRTMIIRRTPNHGVIVKYTCVLVPVDGNNHASTTVKAIEMKNGPKIKVDDLIGYSFIRPRFSPSLVREELLKRMREFDDIPIVG